MVIGPSCCRIAAPCPPGATHAYGGSARGGSRHRGVDADGAGPKLGSIWQGTEETPGWIRASRAGSIVVLTGAGISKESGLDTFRCAGGIWSRVNLEDVATPEGFARNPVLVHQFYNARRSALADPAVVPNAAHLAIARLEREWHARGPGRHPEHRRSARARRQQQRPAHARRAEEGALRELRRRCSTGVEELGREHVCPACGASGRLRPHVVWFGEMPLDMDRIYAALDRCALFISVGTSGNVYPAAGFVSHVRMYTRAHTVELNLEPSTGATLFAEAIYGPASEVVPEYVDWLLAGRA